MTYLVDIAMIMASCTLANHMGLIEAMEGVIGFRLHVVNCSRCSSFWCVLVYTLINGNPIIPSVAISFLSAYAAVWFELILGLIDKLYNYVYKSAYSTEAADKTDTEDAVS